MTITGSFAWVVLFATMLVLMLGLLVVIVQIDKLLEKALKAITNKYELWGIMREASALYHAKKKAKKEAR